jgi:homoserine O-acetyltransferase/O-succinyltransferase
VATAAALKQRPPQAAAPTARELRAKIPDGFRLESGGKLADGEIRFRITGAPGAPAIIVAGGISADRYPDAGPAGERGWWSDVVRPGGAVDLDRFQVLAFDFTPGPIDQPIAITTADQARLLVIALDAAGIDRAAGFVGASYGGMVGLAFAAAFPERLERLVVLGAAHRPHPMATAWRGVQRRIIALAAEAGRPEEGVALARELAMTTYRSPEEFAGRFDATAPASAGGAYPVCDYLIACGRRYPARMTAGRLVSLSDSVDRHRVQPEAIATPTTVIAFDSDRLTPLEDARELARRLPALAALHVLPSIYGHDGFLKEAAALKPILARAFASTDAAAKDPEST